MRTESCTKLNPPADSLDDLLLTVAASLDRIAEQALTWSDHTLIRSPILESCELEIAAIISIVGNTGSFFFVISTTEQECAAIARALFMIGGQDDLPDDIDVAETLGEFANMVAGEVKRRRSEKDDSIRIGIPLVLRGTAHWSWRDAVPLAASEHTVGPTMVQIGVLHTIPDNLTGDER